MRNLGLVAGVASIACLSAPAPASTAFSLDSASSITVTSLAGGCVGLFLSPANCTLTAALGDGADGYIFEAGGVGDRDDVAAFIDWTIVFDGRKPTGGEAYAVALDLVISGPDMARATAKGSAAFGMLGGVLNAGGLIWDDEGRGSIAFADGSVLGYDLEGIFERGFGLSTSSGVRFTAEALAPVSLPAAGWLLLAGLGATAAASRRRRRN